MILVKSITDVITNSSSEAYTVKNSGNAGEVQDKFYEYLESLGIYGTEENHEHCGLFDADFTNNPDGSVYVDYAVLCNLDNCQGYLETVFGKENVIPDDWNHGH